MMIRCIVGFLLISLENVASWETKMYQELSDGNIKGNENENDEKLVGTLALKLDG